MNRLVFIALLLLALAPFLVNPGLVFITGFAMIEIVFALSWNILFSYAGLVSFGHAAFFGIGAYVAAAALRYGFGVNFVVLLVLCAGIGAIAAFVVAIIVLRRASGIQFAVLTLALSQLVATLIGYSDFFGHDEGISGIPRPIVNLGLFVIDLNKPLVNYYFVFLACLVSVGLMWLLVHGPWGRAMQAVRIDAERAQFVGINVWRIRVLAFTLSGAFAAFAGALLAPWGQIVTPDYVNWLHSAQPIFATLLGGAGFFWGPAVGALGLSALNYLTRTSPGFSELLVGLSLLAVVLIAPKGILGSIHQIIGQKKRAAAGDSR
jgi:branched-chain amino acid transport system permease protein